MPRHSLQDEKNITEQQLAEFYRDYAEFFVKSIVMPEALQKETNKLKNSHKLEKFNEGFTKSLEKMAKKNVKKELPAFIYERDKNTSIFKHNLKTTEVISQSYATAIQTEIKRIMTPYNEAIIEGLSQCDYSALKHFFKANHSLFHYLERKRNFNRLQKIVVEWHQHYGNKDNKKHLEVIRALAQQKRSDCQEAIDSLSNEELKIVLQKKYDACINQINFDTIEITLRSSQFRSAINTIYQKLLDETSIIEKIISYPEDIQNIEHVPSNLFFQKKYQAFVDQIIADDTNIQKLLEKFEHTNKITISVIKKHMDYFNKSIDQATDQSTARIKIRIDINGNISSLLNEKDSSIKDEILKILAKNISQEIKNDIWLYIFDQLDFDQSEEMIKESIDELVNNYFITIDANNAFIEFIKKYCAQRTKEDIAEIENQIHLSSKSTFTINLENWPSPQSSTDEENEEEYNELPIFSSETKAETETNKSGPFSQNNKKEEESIKEKTEINELPIFSSNESVLVSQHKDEKSVEKSVSHPTTSQRISYLFSKKTIDVGKELHELLNKLRTERRITSDQIQNVRKIFDNNDPDFIINPIFQIFEMLIKTKHDKNWGNARGFIVSMINACKYGEPDITAIKENYKDMRSKLNNGQSSNIDIKTCDTLISSLEKPQQYAYRA